MSGPEQRAVGRRRRSAPASRSAAPPWVQNHGGEFGLTYRKRCTLPGWRGSDKLTPETIYGFRGVHAYLDHLRVIKPPAQEGLDQRKHLLQHNNHLKESLEIKAYTRKQPSSICAYSDMCTAKLTGFCAPCEGEGLGLDAASKLSPCLLTSRVVKRLDSIPRMWMMDCLLVGLAWNGWIVEKGVTFRNNAGRIRGIINLSNIVKFDSKCISKIPLNLTRFFKGRILCKIHMTHVF